MLALVILAVLQIISGNTLPFDIRLMFAFCVFAELEYDGMIFRKWFNANESAPFDLAEETKLEIEEGELVESYIKDLSSIDKIDVTDRERTLIVGFHGWLRSTGHL